MANHTALCPTTTFLGQPLYRDKRTEINQQEVNRRLDKYYWPYHKQLEENLNRLKKKFGKVLLWDCHSIRQVVPTIQKEKFPDMILGDAMAPPLQSGLIETALTNLDHADYSVNHIILSKAVSSRGILESLRRMSMPCNWK